MRLYRLTFKTKKTFLNHSIYVCYVVADSIEKFEGKARILFDLTHEWYLSDIEIVAEDSGNNGRALQVLK